MTANRPTLDSTLAAFQNGDIDKPTFIKQMYESHHSALFDYASFIANTNIARIEIEDGRVTIESRDRGVKIECGAGDMRIAPIESLNFADYEKTDSDMMEELLDDGDSFFDIGANIGWYSINLALSRRKSKFYAFEPIPKTFGQLKRNVEINAVKQVEINNFGFSEAEATLQFYYYPEGSGNASSRNLAERQDAETISCQVKKLDDYIAETSRQVDFIKCDVEGAELMVFRGGIETIRRDKPIIFSEILRKWSAKFDYDPNEIFTLLRSAGYRSFTAEGGSLLAFEQMTTSTVETNFFFLHTERHAQKINRLTSK